MALASIKIAKLYIICKSLELQELLRLCVILMITDFFHPSCGLRFVDIIKVTIPLIVLDSKLTNFLPC